MDIRFVDTDKAFKRLVDGDADDIARLLAMCVHLMQEDEGEVPLTTIEVGGYVWRIYEQCEEDAPHELVVELVE